MITTERERQALVDILHNTSELVALGADQILILTRDAHTDPGNAPLLLLMPGARQWVSLTSFLERCAGDSDNGRGALLEIWPSCPPDIAEKILAAVTMAPMFLGGGA